MNSPRPWLFSLMNSCAGSLAATRRLRTARAPVGNLIWQGVGGPRPPEVRYSGVEAKLGTTVHPEGCPEVLRARQHEMVLLSFRGGYALLATVSARLREGPCCGASLSEV